MARTLVLEGSPPLDPSYAGKESRTRRSWLPSRETEFYPLVEANVPGLLQKFSKALQKWPIRVGKRPYHHGGRRGSSTPVDCAARASERDIRIASPEGRLDQETLERVFSESGRASRRERSLRIYRPHSRKKLQSRDVAAVSRPPCAPNVRPGDRTREMKNMGNYSGQLLTGFTG